MKSSFLHLIVIFLLSSSCTISAQSIANTINKHPELGNVNWHRNYDDALALSKQENKPLFILFQEVPGCATCVNYGQNVLTHPILVDAIENECIPLAIFNNKVGKDKKILDKFNEPTWNNPVVRIINGEEQDLTKRVAGNYSIQGVYDAITSALHLYGNEIPPYLTHFGEALSLSHQGNLEEIYFSMYCFWTGEKQLAKADGVYATEAGFMSGHEVVKVLYNHTVTSEKALITHAKASSCKPIKKNATYTIDADPQYYLKKSAYQHLPLTTYQKTKINSLLGEGVDASHLLSPTQQKWLAEQKQFPLLYTQDFNEAWKLRMITK